MYDELSEEEKEKFFPKGFWKDYGSYIVHNGEQGTESWLDARAGKSSCSKERIPRITTSNVGKALGHVPKSFGDSGDLIEEIAAGVSKVFTTEQLERMKKGSDYEWMVRRWYEKEYKVNVKECGLCVPKWNIHLGGSTDGEVEGTEGIIEIKCPGKMPWKILEYCDKLMSGHKFGAYYHDHIYQNYYDQMQCCMIIMNKKWCDHIVYSCDDETTFVTRVLFNEDYWKKELCPKLDIFINK
jgi:hypothetical protein